MEKKQLTEAQLKNIVYGVVAVLLVIKLIFNFIDWRDNQTIKDHLNQSTIFIEQQDIASAEAEIDIVLKLDSKQEEALNRKEVLEEVKVINEIVADYENTKAKNEIDKLKLMPSYNWISPVALKIEDSINENLKAEELAKQESESKEKEAIVDAIKGSSATDIKLNLTKWGLPEASPEESKTTNGIVYYSSATDPDTGVALNYYILANKRFEIISASFSVANIELIDEESFLGVSKGFLSYCATLPYDAADQSTIKKWVEDNMANANKQGKVLTKTIGDARFELFGNDNGGRFLTVNLIK